MFATGGKDLLEQISVLGLGHYEADFIFMVDWTLDSKHECTLMQTYSV